MAHIRSNHSYEIKIHIILYVYLLFIFCIQFKFKTKENKNLCRVYIERNIYNVKLSKATLFIKLVEDKIINSKANNTL